MTHRKTILVADDDEALVALFSASLQAWGFRVITAVDAVQATMMVRKTPPHVVILDVKMPGGTGLDVLKRIKAFDAQSMEIPVIVITASADPQLSQAAMALGADEFMQKPLDLAQLHATIGRLLGQPGTGE